MLLSLHDGLLQALASEQHAAAAGALLQALQALLRGAPYHRLPEDLLPRTLEVERNAAGRAAVKREAGSPAWSAPPLPSGGPAAADIGGAAQACALSGSAAGRAVDRAKQTLLLRSRTTACWANQGRCSYIQAFRPLPEVCGRLWSN